MNKREVLAFLNENPVCHLATIDNDKPRVRGLLMYRADETGILFHTGNFKDLYKQLQVNPQVELCFNNLKSNIQVRVSGTSEFVEDQNLKEEIVGARDFLKTWIKDWGYEMLVVFRVVNCKATVWSIETNFNPKEYIDL